MEFTASRRWKWVCCSVLQISLAAFVIWVFHLIHRVPDPEEVYEKQQAGALYRTLGATSNRTPSSSCALHAVFRRDVA